MLKILRKRQVAKKIWLILAIIIIPAFCFWGIGSVLRGRDKAKVFGKAFGKTITTQEFIKNYKALRNKYILSMGKEQFAKLEKYLNLRRAPRMVKPPEKEKMPRAITFIVSADQKKRIDKALRRIRQESQGDDPDGRLTRGDLLGIMTRNYLK